MTNMNKKDNLDGLKQSDVVYLYTSNKRKGIYDHGIYHFERKYKDR